MAQFIETQLCSSLLMHISGVLGSSSDAPNLLMQYTLCLSTSLSLLSYLGSLDNYSSSTRKEYYSATLICLKQMPASI